MERVDVQSEDHVLMENPSASITTLVSSQQGSDRHYYLNENIAEIELKMRYLLLDRTLVCIV